MYKLTYNPYVFGEKSVTKVFNQTALNTFLREQDIDVIKCIYESYSFSLDVTEVVKEISAHYKQIYSLLSKLAHCEWKNKQLIRDEIFWLKQALKEAEKNDN